MSPARRTPLEVAPLTPLSQTPHRNRTFWMSDGIAERLDVVVDRCRDAGYVLGRAELVAALIVNCTSDAEQLEAWVRSLRTATLGDVLASTGDHVELSAVLPGPRPRRPRSTT